ncbi:thioesterase superfamily protein [Colletotrichum falcatum]|nr:thioesterase superfamily protein [Colletotrichum falcatum]
MASVDPDVQHFLSIPWCATLLGEPGTICKTSPSRFPKASTEDQLFSTTLRTVDSVAAFVLFYKRPSSPAVKTAPAAAADDEGGNLIRELNSLLTLGAGVNGFANVSHGGIVATLLDETIGTIFLINELEGLMPSESFMTAYLNVTYLRPVETPQTVLCVAEVLRIKGRKWWIRGRIEDRERRVLAKAESLFVRLKENL